MYNNYEIILTWGIFMSWSVEIVTDLELVNNGSLELNEFVNKHWEKFKPVYINFHKCCFDEADLFLLVHEFFSKIIRADVQPLFQSDNQIFNYFKTAVRNKHYDNTHKKEIVTISFAEYVAQLESSTPSNDSLEDKIPDESTNIEEEVLGELTVEEVLKELSGVLSDKYIKLLVLLYKYQLTPKEARRELGVSLTTVRDRIGKIRKVLKNHCGIHHLK